jgi:hypothetical protein
VREHPTVSDANAVERAARDLITKLRSTKQTVKAAALGLEVTLHHHSEHSMTLHVKTVRTGATLSSIAQGTWAARGVLLRATLDQVHRATLDWCTATVSATALGGSRPAFEVEYANGDHERLLMAERGTIWKTAPTTIELDARVDAAQPGPELAFIRDWCADADDAIAGSDVVPHVVRMRDGVRLTWERARSSASGAPLSIDLWINNVKQGGCVSIESGNALRAFLLARLSTCETGGDVGGKSATEEGREEEAEQEGDDAGGEEGEGGEEEDAGGEEEDGGGEEEDGGGEEEDGGGGEEEDEGGDDAGEASCAWLHTPAILKALQSRVDTLETLLRDVSGVSEAAASRYLDEHLLARLEHKPPGDRDSAVLAQVVHEAETHGASVQGECRSTLNTARMEMKEAIEQCTAAMSLADIAIARVAEYDIVYDAHIPTKRARTA